MGNRARRRAWAHRVMSDPRLTEFDKMLAMTVADMDPKGLHFLRDGRRILLPAERSVRGQCGQPR